ncbi:MAG TPA: hypothetical protein LFW21_07645 [Rickettsia endosymbiont of Pyrocoelia pectoralis]|nr:hypothetical protein [Rickettsia endosymbiont of Pyrocoelia pectoralis]
MKVYKNDVANFSNSASIHKYQKSYVII